MSYYGKIAIAKLNEKDEKENKMDVESIVKGLRKKELEKAGFDKKTIDYLSKQKNNTEDEKENENFHYLGKTFSVTSGNFQEVRRQVQKAYWDKVKELERKLRSAEGAKEKEIEKELREIHAGYKETMESFDRFNNNKEEKKNASITDRDVMIAQVLMDRIIMHCQKAKKDMKNWNRDWFNYDNWKSKAEQAENIVKDLHI